MMSLSILKLHCDCQYLWLRKWLKRHPGIIAPKAAGEVVKIWDYEITALNRTWISVPVDCAQQNLNDAVFDLSQEAFSVNDACL